MSKLVSIGYVIFLLRNKLFMIHKLCEKIKLKFTENVLKHFILAPFRRRILFKIKSITADINNNKMNNIKGTQVESASRLNLLNWLTNTTITFSKAFNCIKV